MKPIDRRTFLKTVPAFAALPLRRGRQALAAPFGQEFPQLDAQTTGEWRQPTKSKVRRVREREA